MVVTALLTAFSILGGSVLATTSGEWPRREVCSNRFLRAATRTGSCRRTFTLRRGSLWGNLPQTYSMAGIINAVTRLSSSREDTWALGSS